MDINRDILLQSFREETEDCLNQMERLLLALETHPGDRELLSSLFRAAHTIKGNASLLQFSVFAQSLHALEDLLDVFRKQSLILSPEYISLLLQTVDALREIARRVATGDETLQPEQELLFKQLAEIAAEHRDERTNEGSEAARSRPGDENRSVEVTTSTVQNLRVDVRKLDRMLNLSVEFAIAQGRLKRMLEELSGAEGSAREVRQTHQDLMASFLEMQELITACRFFWPLREHSGPGCETWGRQEPYVSS
jgi:two-component system, chemotaxis family, sensor kinase CheA